MAEIIEHIPELKGVDAELFHKNLDKELTEEEIKAVRAWALPGFNKEIIVIIINDLNSAFIKLLSRIIHSILYIPISRMDNGFIS